MQDAEDPDWAEVIEVAYQSAQGYVQWQGDLPEDHPHKDEDPPFDLRDHTDLTDEEIGNAVGFATNTGLMKQIGGSNPGMNYQLEETGFDVAHERQLRKERQAVVERQANVGTVTAIFTGVLAANAVINLITTLDVTPSARNWLFIAAIGIAGVVSVAVKWYLGSTDTF